MAQPYWRRGSPSYYLWRISTIFKASSGPLVTKATSSFSTCFSGNQDGVFLLILQVQTPTMAAPNGFVQLRTCNMSSVKVASSERSILNTESLDNDGLSLHTSFEYTFTIGTAAALRSALVILLRWLVLYLICLLSAILEHHHIKRWMIVNKGSFFN